jgi:hypothetical protein
LSAAASSSVSVSVWRGLRLKELERENQRLKRIVADQVLTRVGPNSGGQAIRRR